MQPGGQPILLRKANMQATVVESMMTQRSRLPEKGVSEPDSVSAASPTVPRLKGVVTIGGVGSEELARTYGTPLFVTDEDRLRENYRRIRRAFSGKWPDVRIYYAMKANGNLSILNILRQEGASVDCSGVEEARLALMAGFRAEDILLTANYIDSADLTTALSMGVRVNLDDSSALGLLTETKIPRFISFRVNIGFGKGHHSGVVTAGRDSKFGTGEKAVVQAYEEAKAMGVQEFGIHVMAGSGSIDARYFGEITNRLLKVAENVRSRVGIEFSLVDIGGGFGIPYRPEERPLDIGLAAQCVTDEMRKSFGNSARHPTLALEPGRYIAGDSTVLLSRVRSVKRGEKTMVGIDAGMNTLLRPALYGAYHEVILANRWEEGAEKVDVCGTICENTDIMARDRFLPRMRAGDLVAILDVGAYGFSMSSQYNTNPRPAEVLVRDGNHELIREREELSDIVGRQHVPSRLIGNGK
jgi:diaminopimelate decarboxylase